MSVRRRGATACLALLGLLLAGGVQAGARVALVIGNGAYQRTAVLRNPANDARAIADALRQLGYTVQLVTDASKPAMEAALVGFATLAHGADQALIFYSGHGIEMHGVNYLVPVEARLATESTVKSETVSLQELMDIASQARHLGLVVLDACRDNPLAYSMERVDGAKDVARGLAGVEPRGGSLQVAYATMQGQVAADGKGEHSPYTSAILAALNVKGLEIGQFWRKVRRQVLSDTHNAQEPFTYGTLDEEALYLNPPAPAVAVSVPPSPKYDPVEVDYWKSAQSLGLKGYQAYLKRYPQGQFADIARLELERLSPPVQATSGTAQPPLPSGSGGGSLTTASMVPPAAHDAAVSPADKSFRDCTTGCPEMVTLAGGSFRMGSPDNEPNRVSGEGPQHLVQVKSFAIGKYDVTFDEWDICVKEGGCKTRPSDEGWGRGRRPVINISWDDAQQYADWLSRKTRYTYRLLSEAEWEYAARAGTDTAYYWGTEAGKGHANCDGCGSRWDNKLTAPVGSFDPNKWDLYDMAGNVYTWTQDCYHDTYTGAPKDGSAWDEANCKAGRVVRGGSWYDYSQNVRVAYRYWGYDADGFVGLRLARTF